MNNIDQRQRIEEVIRQFPSLNLSQVGEAALMKRIDNKYILPQVELPQLLEDVKEYYDVLEIEEERMMLYNTLYYDFEDFDFFKMHHRGKMNRYKVRERLYANTDTSFLEIKFKDNKDKTHKYRRPIESVAGGFKQEDKDFIKSCTDVDADVLEPKLWVDYRRITLVSKKKNERSTIDVGLTFRKNDTIHSFEGIVIIETKREYGVKTTPMMDFLKQKQVRPEGFSKYCIGASMLFPELKQNAFKPKIRKAKQILENR